MWHWNQCSKARWAPHSLPHLFSPLKHKAKRGTSHQWVAPTQTPRNIWSNLRRLFTQITHWFKHTSLVRKDGFSTTKHDFPLGTEIFFLTNGETSGLVKKSNCYFFCLSNQATQGLYHFNRNLAVTLALWPNMNSHDGVFDLPSPWTMLTWAPKSWSLTLSPVFKGLLSFEWMRTCLTMSSIFKVAGYSTQIWENRLAVRPCSLYTSSSHDSCKALSSNDCCSFISDVTDFFCSRFIS